MSPLIPPQLPPKWDHTAKQIPIEMDQIIEASKKVNDQVGSIAIDDVSVENVLNPFAQCKNVQNLPKQMLTFYQHVSADKALRDASSEASEKLENYEIEADMREDVYKVFNKLYNDTKDSQDLEPIDKRFIEKTNKGFERSGLALSEEKRQKIKELQQRLSSLAIKFSKNLGEQTEYLLFTREELDGLPESVIEQLKVVEDDDGVEKLKVTYKYPEIIPTMKYAKNAETRKAAFIGDQNKVPENAGILAEAVKLRAELASTLGYESFAEYVLEDRMAKTPKAVMDFLTDLRSKLLPLGLKDRETLLALKKQDLKERGIETEDSNELYIWDSNFYNNLLLQKEYQIDEEKLSEYFPMESTVAKMLGIFEKLFNLKFEEVLKDSDLHSTWHEDVKQFSVWKIDDPTKPAEFVGWLYFDLFPREGKFGHAANFSIGSSFIKQDGSKSYPVTALVCNFSKPTSTKPSLLKHKEVTTFFHELGHGIHDLIGFTKYSKFSGTSVSWDFVECPSLMLEFWTWSKTQLKELSSHYEKPDQKLPDDLIDSLVSSEHVNDGLFNLRQLFFGFFDMKLHTSKTGDLDLTKEWNEIRQDVSLVAHGDTVSKGYGSFGHLLGGYEAGYYGYLWSRAFAADIYYTKFKDDPMNKANGLLYRDTILARGGSMDNMDMLVELLGRKPNSEAYLKDLGL